MYYIYKTTNIQNGKYYIGVTNGNNKWYKGSGTALKNAIKKYGGGSFNTVMLEEFNTEEEAFKKEAELVTEEVVKDHNSYNLKVGGKGGSGQKKSTEHKQKISEAVKQKYKDGTYKNVANGRKPAMDPTELLSLVEEHGLKKVSVMLDIKYDTLAHRYYRYRKM